MLCGIEEMPGMQASELDTWLDIATKIMALFAAFVGGLWAYTKFVVERGFLPPVEFTIDCNVVGKQTGNLLVEVLLHLKNVGTSTLVAKDIAARLRYLKTDDVLDVSTEFTEKKEGKPGAREVPPFAHKDTPRE
jgi:hypothetical protein